VCVGSNAESFSYSFAFEPNVSGDLSTRECPNCVQ
jgi:hypothetical protein